MMITRGWGIEEMLNKEYTLAVRRWVSSEDLMNNAVIIVSSIVLLFKFAKRLYLKCSHPPRHLQKKELCDIIGALANTMVVIILLYIKHITYLKFIQCYISIIYQLKTVSRHTQTPSAYHLNKCLLKVQYSYRF